MHKGIRSFTDADVTACLDWSALIKSFGCSLGDLVAAELCVSLDRVPHPNDVTAC